MKLKLNQKDNPCATILDDVETFTLEGETLLVVFEDGTTRNYPLMHLWYYESAISDHAAQRTVGDDWSVHGIASNNPPKQKISESAAGAIRSLRAYKRIRDTNQ